MGEDKECTGTASACCVNADGCCRKDGKHNDDQETVDKNQQSTTTSTIMVRCIALVEESMETVLTVFDVDGTAKRYQCSVPIRDLCFHNHGMDGTLLTPCFDEAGRHEQESTDCFCGEDTPHWHAHLKTMCEKEDQLAMATLYAMADDHEDEESITKTKHHRIDISPAMPNSCCNSMDGQGQHDEKVPTAHGYQCDQRGHNHQHSSEMHLHSDHSHAEKHHYSDQSIAEKHSDHGQAEKLQHSVHHQAEKHQHSDHCHAEQQQCSDHSCHAEKHHHSDHAEKQQCSDHSCHAEKHSDDSCHAEKLQHSGHHQPDKHQHSDQGHAEKHHHSDHCHAEKHQRSDHCHAEKQHHSDHRHAEKHQHSDHCHAEKHQLSDHCRAEMHRDHHTDEHHHVDRHSPHDKNHRVFPKSVHHGDSHLDDLILDEITGELLLRNPNCKTCIVCWHGKFKPVATRKLSIGHFSIYIVPTDPFFPKERQRSVRSTIYCGGICCSAELPAVGAALQGLLGVVTFYVNVPLKQVNIDHNPDHISAQELLLRLSSVGGTTVLKDGALTEFRDKPASVQSKFTVSGAEATPLWKQECPLVENFIFDQDSKTLTAIHCPMIITASQIARQVGATVVHDGSKDLFPKKNDNDDESKQRFPRPTVIVSGILWVVSMLSLIGGVWSNLHWVALVSIAFGLPPIAMRAFHTLQRWRFDTNCLMLFASIGAIGLRDFTEAAAVVFLFALSEWLELRATWRARTALMSIIHLRPDVAVVAVKEDFVTVPAAIVPVGTLVLVKVGEKIPCDGTVHDGMSLVDESSLTGESRPISKIPGSTVAGGTVNCGVSPLTIRTTATAENSAVSRLIRLVEEAQGNRSATEKSVDRFAAVYTPIVVFGALCMCTIPWFFGVGREWTQSGLVLLVVACPCALIISTPVAYVAGLAATASRGLLIKGGSHLETMAAVNRICFDKTGTLTNGKFALLELEVLAESLTRHQILAFLVAMEEKASHPIAQALVMAARNEGVAKDETLVLTGHKILNGEGVEGNVNGQKVYVGNDSLFNRLGLEVPRNGSFSGFMSIEGYGLVCSFIAADAVRPEAAEVIASLKSLGIESTMLTGDNEAAALSVGEMVGLPSDKVKSKLLPEDKYNLVKAMVDDPANRFWFKGRRLMMIGDGVNDAPALAIADVGVAMGEGAALSMETADITLLDSDLRKIEYCIRMGRRVSNKIVQNIVFSIAVKAIVLVFALLGKADLWAAIASDVGAMLVVTINAMTLLPRRIGSDVVPVVPTQE